VADPNEIFTGYETAPGPPDIEAKIGVATARRVVWVGPPVIAAFALARGGSGAVAATLGVAIVAGNFVIAGFVLSKAAAISMKLYHAAALGGFFLRLTLIMMVMFLIAQAVDVDRPAMGVAAVVSYLALLSWETVAVARGETKELEWS
jgi:hypothetical protein